jgi:ribonuclease J
MPPARAGVRILPLGGLGEIGMNAMAIVQGRDALLVDCGVSFADRAFGADVIHPDFSALLDFEVRGIVITHGHEDHIGAVPYFLRRFDVPVFGPSYALSLLADRTREHEVLFHADLIDVAPRKPFKVGPFGVEAIRVAHSTADATALAIETEAGIIFHTGDFKFDDDADPSQAVDTARIAELSRAGISLLLSDSTNADREGTSGSERTVAIALSEIVHAAKAAVVVTLFASNVDRLDALGRIALESGRRLVLVGRSMERHLKVARRLGLLGFPADILWPEERMQELPRNKILTLATGSQGEQNAGLAKLSRDEVPGLSLGEGDTVILSSRVIPGHELEVQRIIGDLLRKGASVRFPSRDPGIHVSGHACRDEQRRMLELTAPAAFIPVHGAVHHLHAHADLAREAGVSTVQLLENGQSAHLSPRAELTRDADFRVGKVFTWDRREVSPSVLGERKALAHEGVAFLSLPLEDDGSLAGTPELQARGVMMEPHLERARPQIFAEIAESIRALPPPHDRARSAEAARLATRRVLSKLTGHKPVVVVSTPVKTQSTAQKDAG